MQTLIKSVSSPVSGMRPVELHGIGNKKSVELKSTITGGQTRNLDTVWLSKAAEHYQISPDLNDYILVPVPVCITDVPNTNGDCASLKQLTSFLPEFGCLSYKTWCGKPLHVEHDNKDIRKARGVILDSYLMPLVGFKGNHAKMIHLAALDRKNYPQLAKAYLDEEVNTFSMGMWYKSYRCSICGAHVGKGHGAFCPHTRPGRPTHQMPDGRLAYRECEYLQGFELSCVEDPAFVSANSERDWIMDPNKL